MNFHLKMRKIDFESSIAPLFDELHCSQIVHMNRMEPIFQDLPFYCTKKVPKIHNKFCHFRHGGGTHFLVLALTLMRLYAKTPKAINLKLLQNITSIETIDH